ncbi:single-stranded DNA-binding protein [Mesomycoplasma flocculare]|uniref:single-stranded DNA-binding protein n=1 Tax=Mesomycoplasma flocculare TaxID=2128 RepID=UPI00136C0921|nr:single-stranded DNA-binding protein [Mesomycoplasma flocculare]MXR22799.1 single-stranded DNA-binding protein [Mesomycoplasma flocculare]
MNKIILIGRVSSKPVLLNTKSNLAFLRFNLAVSRRKYSHDGSQITDFIPIVAWRQNATLLDKLITVGSLLAIEGSLQGNRVISNTNAYITNYEVSLENFQTLETKDQLEMRRQKLSQKTSTPTFETIYDDPEMQEHLDFRHSIKTEDEKSQFFDLPTEIADNIATENKENPFADYWDIDDLDPNKE